MSKSKHGNSIGFLAMSALSLALFCPGKEANAAGTAAPAGMAVTKEEQAALSLAQGLSSAFQRVAREVTPTVVHITATKGDPRSRSEQLDARDQMLRRFFGGGGDSMPQATSFGSGIVVSPDGYILTNNHVVEGSTNITVKFGDNRTFDGKLIGRDPETDVAVLKIEGSNLPFAELGDSDKLGVGEWVLAIGNPFGLNQTVTAGIVSAKGRTLPDSPQRGQNRFEDFIQTDAAINPGNSGGPLVNLQGQIVGMNTAIYSRAGGYMGIGFAIPSNMARNIMDSIISTGTVQRGWLGVGIQPLDEATAKSLGFDRTEGVVINNIVAGGPAEKAGLQAEDVITAIDGRVTSSDNALRNIIATLPPGKTVKLSVFRGGKNIEVDATIAKRDDAKIAAAAGAIGADNRLGVGVSNVTADVARQLGMGRAVGVVVTEIAETSPAAGFLNPMDVILRIDGRDIRSIDDYREATRSVSFRKGVRIIVYSQGIQRVLTLRDSRAGE